MQWFHRYPKNSLSMSIGAKDPSPYRSCSTEAKHITTIYKVTNKSVPTVGWSGSHVLRSLPPCSVEQNN